MGTLNGSTPKFRIQHRLMKSPRLPMLKILKSWRLHPYKHGQGFLSLDLLMMNPCANCLRLQYKRAWLVSQKALKKLRNGSLFVERATENRSRNLRSKILFNVPIQISPYVSQYIKGCDKVWVLEGVSEEEIIENLSSQGVAFVRRIKVRRNNELVPTNTDPYF